MAHHGAGLRKIMVKEGQEPEVIEKLLSDLKKDYQLADISEKETAVLDYAKKLTLAPESIQKADITQLRTQGFNDRGIHDICAVTAYFAFVNRIADGLGVELES